MSRIVSDHDILHGRPRIKGTRISVGMVLELLASEVSPKEICMRWYPDLTVEDVYACLDFATRFLNAEKIHVTHRPRHPART